MDEHHLLRNDLSEGRKTVCLWICSSGLLKDVVNFRQTFVRQVFALSFSKGNTLFLCSSLDDVVLFPQLRVVAGILYHFDNVIPHKTRGFTIQAILDIEHQDSVLQQFVSSLNGKVVYCRVTFAVVVVHVELDGIRDALKIIQHMGIVHVSLEAQQAKRLGIHVCGTNDVTSFLQISCMPFCSVCVFPFEVDTIQLLVLITEECFQFDVIVLFGHRKAVKRLDCSFPIVTPKAAWPYLSHFLYIGEMEPHPA